MTGTRMFGAAGRAVRARWSGIVAMALATMLVSHALAQAPAAPGGAASPPSAEELAKLVGPIALYPDDLVAIILPASTNPLQLVQADRFLAKRKSDPKLPVDDRWDDPVKSLLNYPDVVKMMSADLDWTTALGEAVVADQGAVIEAVQAFRRKAKAAGSLKSDDKQVVKIEQETVYIVPADPQVIYVPQYNPTTVIVQSAPPIYYPTPYPAYYYPYPPGAALAAGVIWGAAIGAAWSGNHYGCCGDANINVNRNTNINTGNVNRGGAARQQPAGGGSAWKPNKQPGQVGGSVGKTASSARAGYGSAGGAGAGRASAQGTAAGAGGAGAGRASTQAAGGGAASRGGGGGAAGRGGGDALGGYGSGRQTQMDSSRGAASRSTMSGSGARPSSGGASRSMPSGGGARGGGGGGRGGGGGGGRR
jgi:hypothetical protein